MSNVSSQRVETGTSPVNLSRDQPFNAPLTIKSARFPKNAKTFLFVKCHGQCTNAKWQNLNWTTCCFTFGRFTQPSKVLHSDGKFIQPNMWTAEPSFAKSSFSNFLPFSPFFSFFLFLICQFPCPQYINHFLPSCPPCFPREGLW